MTQHGERTFPLSRVILFVAVVLAAFAIGYAISNSQDDTSAANAPNPEVSAAPSGIPELEKVTADDPKNGQAWQQLGAAYFNEGRYEDAVGAYSKAIGIDPDQPLVWSALGEARVMASERDPMPAAAVEAFEKSIALDPKDPRARYFIAVKRDLTGDHEGALSDWLALLEDTPADAPWRSDLVRTIEQVGQINQIDVTKRLAAAGEKSPPPAPVARAIPGPSADQLAAASQIPPGEQRDMAEGMVSRLEQRLKGNPGNVDGWVMLMRSRVTLNQPGKAKKALTDAVAANPDKADFLRQQAAVLGVKP